MTESNIAFQVETARVLQILANEIYDSPLAMLRENVQNAYDAVRMQLVPAGRPLSEGRIDLEIGPKSIKVTDTGIGMTKADLINQISEKAGITRVKAETVVNTIFDSMIEALMRDDRIEIRGFGSFVNRQYGAYQGRNPRTGEDITIAAAKTVKFSAGKAFKDALNKK